MRVKRERGKVTHKGEANQVIKNYRGEEIYLDSFVDPTDTWLTVKQVARELNRHPASIQNWISWGLLQRQKDDRYLVNLREAYEVREWLQNNKGNFESKASQKRGKSNQFSK